MEMREIMSKIAILTDSSCDIPQEMAEKYGIDIMSFLCGADFSAHLQQACAVCAWR